MSLYNLLHGYNSNSMTALALVDLVHVDVGRFRDAWIEEDGRHVSVFTRNGGGNREAYQEVIDQLATLPGYVEDFDDDFDCTYATIRFAIPEKYWPIADQLKPQEKQPSLYEKTNQALEAIGTSAKGQDEKVSDDVVKRVEEALRKAVEAEREEKHHE